MANSYYYDGNQYVPRSGGDWYKGYIMAGAISSGIMGTVLPMCGKPFERQLMREPLQNHLYKDAFLNSLKLSGLDKKGVSIRQMELEKAVSPNDFDYLMGTNAAFFKKTS